MFDYDPITFRDYPVCVTDYTRKQTHVVGWHCVALAEIISFTSDKHQSIGGKRSTRQLVACRLYIIIPHNFISISTPRENGFPGKSATCSKANTQASRDENKSFYLCLEFLCFLRMKLDICTNFIMNQPNKHLFFFSNKHPPMVLWFQTYYAVHHFQISFVLEYDILYAISGAVWIAT